MNVKFPGNVADVMFQVHSQSLSENGNSGICPPGSALQLKKPGIFMMVVILFKSHA